jgi:hypothetical protein
MVSCISIITWLLTHLPRFPLESLRVLLHQYIHTCYINPTPISSLSASALCVASLVTSSPTLTTNLWAFYRITVFCKTAFPEIAQHLFQHSYAKAYNERIKIPARRVTLRLGHCRGVALHDMFRSSLMAA